MAELEAKDSDDREERAIPAWFRREHAITIAPDSRFDLYSGEGGTGIRQSNGFDGDFIQEEAAILFGQSADELFFRASFSNVVPIGCSDDAEKAIREKLYGMQTATFFDYTGPIAKAIQGIAIYRNALDMIPKENLPCPISPSEEGGFPDFLPVQLEENNEEDERQGVLFSESGMAAGDEIQNAIDSEIEKGHGEFLGRYHMCKGGYYPYDIVYLSNAWLVIVHGDLVGEWLAEEEPFMNEPPLWFSETEHRPSPAYQAKMCRNMLRNSVSDVPVVAIVVFPQDTFLLNEDEMCAVWRQECDVHMVRSRKNEQSALPTLHDCLNALPAATAIPPARDIETMQHLAKKLAGNPTEWMNV